MFTQDWSLTHQSLSDVVRVRSISHGGVTLRSPIEIINKHELESEGLTRESAFIESDPTKALVLVYRVDLTGSRLKALLPVVKFSKREHAIPNPEATCIQLATPSYYREYEGSEGNKGIRDEKEAQYERRWEASNVSWKMTLGRKDFWMFCTSVQPPTDWELRKMRDKFEYDCATTIANPSEFAKELGSAFAAYSEWSDVRLSPLDNVLRQSLPPEVGDKVVWVYHGPVVYQRNPATVIEAFPEDKQAAVVPFVKRDQFSDQREYRFTVLIHGEPKEPKFPLPISTALRHLAKIEK